MPTYDKAVLTKQAKQLGFLTAPFEKMSRLTEILRFFNETDELREVLALKGGTAINVVIFNLPRLSVDIDLDFTENLAKEETRKKRDRINELLERYMAAVEYVVMELFQKLQAVSYNQVIESQYKGRLKECEINLNKTKSKEAKLQTALVDLKAEVVNAIRGTSKWSAELLSDVIARTESDLKDISAVIERYEDEILNSQKLVADVKNQYDHLLNWAAIYVDCDIEEKKMILSHIIDKVSVKKGPKIEVELKISIEQFLGATEACTAKQEIAEEAVMAKDAAKTIKPTGEVSEMKSAV